MSKFVILIYESEAGWDGVDQATFDAVLAEHDAFGAKYESVILGGDALQQTPSARTVRSGVVTDGPFLETKEALGGYYVIEADDLDRAVEIAREVPVRFGCVEVRETMVFRP